MDSTSANCNYILDMIYVYSQETLLKITILLQYNLPKFVIA